MVNVKSESEEKIQLNANLTWTWCDQIENNFSLGSRNLPEGSSSREPEAAGDD